MTRVQDFVADLARAGKSFSEIKKKTVEAAYGDRSLSSSQLYCIIKQARAEKDTEDQRHLNPKKTVHTVTLIASVAAAVAADRRIDTRSLAAAHGVCLRTICRILKEDLGLVKKSARWVPKLLSQVQKEDRVRISQEFVDAVERSGLSMLDRIITMDGTLVSSFTPETKRMSKEWTLKGKPGPLKAKVQASRSKQMVFAFFDSRSLIYTHIASRSATINAPYVVDVLGKFWRSLRLKRP
jgi:hypothetical protein